MLTISRRRLAVAAALASLVAPVGAAATTASATAAPTASASSAPYCGIFWGSLPKQSASMTTAPVLGVRSGMHACFDRVVFDLGRGSGRVGYNVRYVTEVAGPSGMPVPLVGGAKIQITLHAPAMRTVPSSGVINYTGWQTFRQLKYVASFEGFTDFGLGVRARLPMRVFTLTNTDGGQRLVVDVANFW